MKSKKQQRAERTHLSKTQEVLYQKEFRRADRAAGKST